MSTYPGQQGQPPPEPRQDEPGTPPPPQPQPPTREQQAQQALEQLLGGELPGAGYLFPASPGERQQHLVPVDADSVREWLLRAIQTAAYSCSLPFGMEKKAELGKMSLEFAQAYLLLDPTVDENGIPVEGAGSVAHAQAAAAHQFPPRVQPNAAEEAVQKKHEPQETALAKTRGQKPTPQPRVGGTGA